MRKTSKFWPVITLDRFNMSWSPYFAILCCLLELATCSLGPTPSTAANPECPGMHRIASGLQRGLYQYTKEKTTCLVNSACTGLMCNGTNKGNDFFMKMELKHCKPKPSIHLDLKYPARKINKHSEMSDGHLEVTRKNGVPVDLKLTLKRHNNQLTTALDLQLCSGLGPCITLFHLLPSTTFCLNMKSCPNHNSSDDVPCHNTQAPIRTTTGPSKTELASLTAPYFSTKHSEPLPGKKAHQKGDGHHHMSVGLAVGIGFACLAAILVTIGVVIYWKKFYRRSRLRAAYYNDISMNDPLYEDFGPEVA